MTKGEEEISASTLYHWASSKEAELVELPCFSVITQRALGQPYVADTNAFPLRSLSQFLCLHTHTYEHSVPAQGHMSAIWEVLKSWPLHLPALEGKWHSVCIVLPRPCTSLCSLWYIHIYLALKFSLIIQTLFFSFCQKNPKNTDLFSLDGNVWGIRLSVFLQSFESVFSSNAQQLTWTRGGRIWG